MSNPPSATEAANAAAARALAGDHRWIEALAVALAAQAAEDAERDAREERVAYLNGGDL